MECKKVIEFIPEYLDGTLEFSKYQEIESHLENCDSCKKEVNAYQKTIQLASNLPIEYPSPEVWDNFVPELLSKIEKSSEKRGLPLLKWQFIRQHSWQFAGMAVSIAIIVAIVFNNFLFVNKPQNEPQTVREVIAENLIGNNVSIKQIDKAIQSIDNPIIVIANQVIYMDDNTITTSEKEGLPDTMDIANAMATEIDSSDLDYDYNLSETIAYLEEYHGSKGK